MSYDGETLKDEALEKYTLGLMEDVVRDYRYRGDYRYKVERLIERRIAKKLVEWIPEKYTEVNIKAMVGKKCTSVIAEFMMDTKTMMVVIHEEVNSVEMKKTIADPYTPYNPISLTEDYFFPNPAFGKGRGSKVETLPGGQDLAESSDFEFFRRNLIRGLKLPAGYLAEKTVIEKPTVDFSKISLLSPPTGFPNKRYSPEAWCGVDLGKVDVHQEYVDRTAKEISDKKILQTLTAAAGLESERGQSIPTSGWAEEKTTWVDSPNNITFSIDFGGIITTDTTPVWYKPNTSSPEKINFTEEDLDLLDMSGSRVMKFV